MIFRCERYDGYEVISRTSWETRKIARQNEVTSINDVTLCMERVRAAAASTVNVKLNRN